MLSTVAEICERLVKAWDPDSIILFGSRAQGTDGPSSDVDLLVVRETEERPIDRRAAAERILGDRSIPIDLLVYTPREMLYLHSIGSPFIAEVVGTGRVLYMRKATEQWVRDAEEELESADILLRHRKHRGACLHAQQCVEKALKGLILEKGKKPERTHDLIALKSEAEQLGWMTELPMDEAAFLSSVYKGRYPAEEGLLPHGDPTDDDARRAVAAARRSFEAVRSQLA